MRDIANIVVLTGAGISAESGVATFRGPGGLWEGHRVEDVCTPEALRADPELVHLDKTMRVVCILALVACFFALVLATSERKPDA